MSPRRKLSGSRKLDLRGLSEPLQQRILETEERMADCLATGGHEASDRLTQPRLIPGVPGLKQMTHVRMVICAKCDVPYKTGILEGGAT